MYEETAPDTLNKMAKIKHEEYVSRIFKMQS